MKNIGSVVIEDVTEIFKKQVFVLEEYITFQF